MGAYKFLMQAYTCDEDIYLFGFSRGAYVARFLAEMLDQVGLLSAGNEEMARKSALPAFQVMPNPRVGFAWKAFAQWQEREEGSTKDLKNKDKMFAYLQGFRSTFSRPVRRIRFLGLFDTGM